MDDFLLLTCGPDPISVTDAVAAVQGYATAKRWLFIRTPSHADGHWVQVPAYRFDAFDAQPADTDLGSLTWSIFAAEGLHGVERDQEKRFAFHREIEALLPLVERAVGHADGRPFWELPARSAAEGPGSTPSMQPAGCRTRTAAAPSCTTIAPTCSRCCRATRCA